MARRALAELADGLWLSWPTARAELAGGLAGLARAGLALARLALARLALGGLAGRGLVG